MGICWDRGDPGIRGDRGRIGGGKAERSPRGSRGQTRKPLAPGETPTASRRSRPPTPLGARRAATSLAVGTLVALRLPARTERMDPFAPRSQSAAARYATAGGESDLSSLADKLTDDLRLGIRNMDLFEVLSAEWCDMANTVYRLGHVSDMEKGLARENDTATLWECEEKALRFVVEEGKLSLSVRNLEAYWAFVQAKDPHGESAVRASILSRFEEGMCKMLRNLWQHEEAVQSSDLGLVFGVMASAWGSDGSRLRAVDESGGPIGDKLEVVAIHWLCAILSFVDVMGERRVMPEIRARRLPGRMLSFLVLWEGRLADADRAAALTALAAVCDTEDFATEPALYFTDEEEELLLRLASIPEYASAGPSNRRAIRPLLDFLRDIRRARR